MLIEPSTHLCDLAQPVELGRSCLSFSLQQSCFSSDQRLSARLPLTMGNCFSDPSAPKASKKTTSKPQGQGHVLGSAPTSTQPASSANVPSHANNNVAGSAPLSPPMMSPGRMLGDGFEDANRGNDPRSVAAAAAEERMKSVSGRNILSLLFLFNPLVMVYLMLQIGFYCSRPTNEASRTEEGN